METNEIVMPGMRLKKLLGKKYDPILQEYDLRPVEVDILVFLYKMKKFDTAKDIIQNTRLSKAHVSKSIEHLKLREFIQIIEDEDDRRILHIKLTDRANEVVLEAIKAHEECWEIMQRGISMEELEIVKNVLLKMAENIDDELKE